MKVWQRVALVVVGAGTLGIGEAAWMIHSAHRHADRELKARAAVELRQKRRAEAALPPAHQFTRAETYDFLAAAKHAEAIGDPLARCIAYPDPPGSHWAPDAVKAYCRYHLQPLLGFAEAEALIEHDRAAELDRRLAAALHAQQTQPASRGLVDRIYLKAFDNGSFDIRPTLDAWKRQSPNSAFAWAASGTAYVAMAAKARGGDYIQQTPESNIRSMENLLAEAAADLRHAIRLDPKLTPAYTALIHAASMDQSVADPQTVIRQALAAAPDDYSIYYWAMGAMEPKWGGSLAAMDALSREAQTHAMANPMLKLFLPERAYYQVYESDLHGKDELARYPAVLDQLTNSVNLTWVGKLASQVGDQAAAAIYQSEVLRFVPEDDRVRVNRAQALLDFDELDWAVTDLGGILARSPHDVFARKVRAYAYDLREDHAHAEQDLRALLADDPRNPELQTRLAFLYMHWGPRWDKSWAIADAMIRDEPQSPNGWLLRATIQQAQPRAGLAETVNQFEARFGNDPRFTQTLLRLRAAVALRRGSGRGKPPRQSANGSAPEAKRNGSNSATKRVSTSGRGPIRSGHT